MPTSGPGSVASAEVVSYEAIRAVWLQLRMPYAPGASETVSVVPHSCLWRNSGSSALLGHVPPWGVPSYSPRWVWCLVFGDEFVAHLKSHQRCSAAFCRPVKFFHTDWIIISLWSLSYTQRHCHVRIEKAPVQTVAIELDSQEYHYMLKH